MKGGKTTVEGNFTNDGGSTSTINGLLTVKKSFTNSAAITTDASSSATERILQWNTTFTHNWGGKITLATGQVINGNSNDSSRPPYNPFSLKTGLGAAAWTIRLVSFSVKWVDNEVVMNWTTLSEEDFSHFSIERSSDARNFFSIT